MKSPKLPAKRPRIGMYFNPRQRLELAFWEGVERYSKKETDWDLIPVPDYRISARELLPTMEWDGLIMAGWHFNYLRGVHWRFPVSACYQDELIWPGSFLANRETGRLAAEHLLTLGAKHFVYFHDLSRGKMDREREYGFREGVESRGYHVEYYGEDPRTRKHGWSLSRQIEDLAEFLRPQQEDLGIFCYDDVHAERMMMACRQAGRNIPGEVALVGVTDTPRFCQMLRPSLSAVEVDTVGMGWSAARTLHRQLTGSSESLHIAVSPLHVEGRESTQVLLSRDALIRRAQDWLDTVDPSDWSVEGLSRALHCSQMTLLRRFRKELGRSPQQEMMRRKLELARTLLASSDDPLSQIAQDCGFVDAAHFSRLFAREAGVPPGAFRRAQG